MREKLKLHDGDTPGKTFELKLEYPKPKVATMSELKCPFCNRNLHKGEDGIYSHLDYMTECKGRLFDGSKELWQELIRTRKALEIAVDALITIKGKHDPRCAVYHIDEKTAYDALAEITALTEGDGNE